MDHRGRRHSPGRRIVLTTFGSLGDLHPYIALALGLQARGHEAIIATTRHYQQRIEARGIGFHAVRPDGPNLDADRDAMRRIMDSRKGTEFVVRELLMPVLRESYEDLLAATDGADLLVSHVLTYAARLVAEKTTYSVGEHFPPTPRFLLGLRSARIATAPELVEAPVSRPGLSPPLVLAGKAELPFVG